MVSVKIANDAIEYMSILTGIEPEDAEEELQTVIGLCKLEDMKACERIVKAILEQMPHTVFSNLDIDAETVKKVFLENGFSFELVDRYFH